MPMPHDYAAAKEEKARLENECDKASKRLKELRGDCRDSMGLTPEHIRALPEFQQAKADYAFWHKALTDFNKTFMCIYRAEYEAERKARRSERI